jgi:hypothetical protein
MTPPGEPLHFGHGEFIRKEFAKYSRDFPRLEEQVMAAIAEEGPHTISPLWRKKSKSGHVLRGAKVTVEVTSSANKTTIFEVMFVRGNDRRSVVRVKQGSYEAKDAAQFCAEYGGEEESKGGKP